MTRSQQLRHCLQGPEITRVAGAGDALSAILVERNGFDAVWASGLAISAFHGVADCSILTMSEFLAAAALMNQAVSIPIVADCDTGFGDAHDVAAMVAHYETAGIAAVCIEDKNFPKRNSFLDDQELIGIDEFCTKIATAKATQLTPDFFVIARLESLIAGLGVEDALERALAYCDAGADAILIHSKSRTPDEVYAFAAAFRAEMPAVPLIAIPTTYYDATCEALAARGFNMVIYANQALRAATRAMDAALAMIREAGSVAPVERTIASLCDIFGLIGMDTPTPPPRRRRTALQKELRS
jgi:phosphoenolpyruvate phosphomutase